MLRFLCDALNLLMQCASEGNTALLGFQIWLQYLF